MRKVFFAAIGLCLLLAAPSLAAPLVQRVVSPGGIEAWLIEDHTLPIVSWQFSFTGGGRLDGDGKSGTADFLAAMLSEGSGPDDATAFAEKLQNLAADISFSADADYLSGGMRCLRDTCAQTLALLHQALGQPRFDKTALARIRAQILAARLEAEKDPSSQAQELWQKTYFAGHAYGRIADAAAIGKITRADILALQKKLWQRGNVQIGVAGAVSAGELAPALDAVFGFLPPGKIDFKAQDFRFMPAPAQTMVHKSLTIPQTFAVFGQAGVKRDHPDFYALTIANHILGGGGFASRLTTEIREKRGLTYGIGTYLVPQREAGIIQGSFAARPEKFADAQKTLAQEWRIFAATITDDEIAAAKNYLLGSFPLRFSSTPRLAEIALSMQQENLGLDFLQQRNTMLESVTPEQVRATAARYFNPATLLFAVIGPQTTKGSSDENPTTPTAQP